jgi:hypothetical protein
VVPLPVEMKEAAPIACGLFYERVRCPRRVPGWRRVRVCARARPGGHRPRRAATDRHVGPDDGHLEAIWHSNVPGTSPISGLFGARRSWLYS